MPGPQPKVVCGNSGLQTQLPGTCITADAIGRSLDGDKRRTLTQIAIDNSKLYK